MPKCVVCDEKFYYPSMESGPGEPCMCGNEFNGDLWDDTWGMGEYLGLLWEQTRWRLAKLSWAIATRLTPELKGDR